MVEFIFDEGLDQQFTDTTIIVNKSSSLNNVLSLLQANTLSLISLNFIKNHQTLTDLKLANNLGRVLKEEGKILIKLTIKDVSESDMAFFQVIYAGSSLKETMRDNDQIELQKNTPKIHSLKSRQTKEYKNVYGDYDYKTQNIKQLVKINPFQQFSQNESEQIDEEQLLNDNIQIKQVDACATKAKACKNCSCGKKEVEEAQDKTQLLTELQQGTIKSSCGSCYLGDAFRCATCPYKGLPAFKQDGKVQINNIDDQNLQVENKQTLVQNGKVRLQI